MSASRDAHRRPLHPRLASLSLFLEESRSVGRGILSQNPLEKFHLNPEPRQASTRIRSDNGSEFICETLSNWLPAMGAKPIPVAAGSPWENGYIESFRSWLRGEFLERVIFEDVADVRAKASWYRREYNAVRPHSSIGYATPKEFSAACDRRRIHQRTK